MKILILLNYVGDYYVVVEEVVVFEKVGFDIVFVVEVYGFDVVSMMGFLVVKIECV